MDGPEEFKQLANSSSSHKLNCQNWSNCFDVFCIFNRLVATSTEEDDRKDEECFCLLFGLLCGGSALGNPAAYRLWNKATKATENGAFKQC